MPKGFTGIRLLLVFIGINLLMILMLVSSMTSSHPWISHILPGGFATGTDSTGYWVFFALVLLVDALTVFIAGLAVMLPALWDGASLNERRLTRHLVDRGGVSDGAKEAVFAALREEAAATHTQLLVGRGILLAGAIFLAVAFFSVVLTFARATPEGHMFVKPDITLSVSAEDLISLKTDSGLQVQNKTVRIREILAYTVDQVLAAAALNAPAIYGVRFAPVINNPRLPLFTHFVFAFRTILGFTLVLFVISFLRRSGRAKAKKKPAAPAAGKKGGVQS